MAPGGGNIGHSESDARLTVAIGSFADVVDRGLRAILSDDRRLNVLPGADPVSEALSAHDVRVAIIAEAGARGPAEFARLRAHRPELGIVVLVQQSSRELGAQLLAWGATACLSTDSEAGEFRTAVRMAGSGRQLFMATVRSVESSTRFAGLASLTSREREVLALLAGRRSNAEIALRLHISIETARTHAASIYRKLGVRSRGELYGLEIPPRAGMQDALNA